MRFAIAALGGVAGLSAMGFFIGVGIQPPAQVRTIPVEVDVRCPGGRVQFTIDPWIVVLNQGDQVEWRLNGNADTDNLEIAPKNPGQWPFAGQPPYRGGKGNPAQPGAMRPNQRGRYAYNIVMTCGPNRLVIDPEVIVGGAL